MRGFPNGDTTLRKYLLPAAGIAGLVLAGGAVEWARRRLVHPYQAPGRPGEPPHWAPADKLGVGTSISGQPSGSSLVWFTLGHGAINEIFFPRTDRPCTRDLAFVVTDGRGFFSDERCDTRHEAEPLADGVPAYRLVNTCAQGRYRIEKRIITHPGRNVVLQQTRFVPLRGSLGGYRLFVVCNPHVAGCGHGNSGWIADQKGEPMLYAERAGYSLAIASSAPWRDRTVGFAGKSDGWTDLRRHGRLTWHYERADGGNVVLTGEIDLTACGGEFLLAVGLGIDPDEGQDGVEAGHMARVALQEDFETLAEWYARGWTEWQGGLRDFRAVDPEGARLYRTSTAVLRIHEDKTCLGSAASLTVPWGQARGDENVGRGGYHLVWPRDLVELGGGLLAAGAEDDVLRKISYLRATQEPGGHWPQNMWINGQVDWTSLQLGETALSIVLVGLARRDGVIGDDDLRNLWPMIRRAVHYIVRRGPTAQEDRWEDEHGYTPFTLSAAIAGLLVAADVAELVGETGIAGYLRDEADIWNDSIERWTYVTDTELARQTGVEGYYLRIAPADDDGEPMKKRGHLELAYQPSTKRRFRPADVVSVDALAYVRFGLRAADDPRVLNTIKVIDRVLKVETPYGPAWHRYRFDGYGEKQDGSPFDNKNGIGRAWPLLTGERAHYELAAGRPDEARRLLRAMAAFAGPAGMISEQVWDSGDIPEHDLYLGRPSGSAMPLAWAHSEYIKLCRSLHEGRIYDMPPQTVERYLVRRTVARHALWRPDHRIHRMIAGRILRIEATEPGVVRWQAGEQRGETRLRDCGLEVYFTDLPTEHLTPDQTVEFMLTLRSGPQPRGRFGLPAGPWVMQVDSPESFTGHESAFAIATAER